MPEVPHGVSCPRDAEAMPPADWLPVVYEELRKLAVARMSREAPGQTLQPTALVHEAWLRLMGKDGGRFENQAHFFAAAAEAMRRILVEKARHKLAAKRGARVEHLALENVELAAETSDEKLLQVHDALEQLAAEDGTAAQIVTFRFFVGFSNEETAALLGVNEKTVRRHWNHAKVWLHERIRMGPP